MPPDLVYDGVKLNTCQFEEYRLKTIQIAGGQVHDCQTNYHPDCDAILLTDTNKISISDSMYSNDELY